ncbi:hypothetical protein AO269_10450 [Pseudomonas putida]|nr:hypothetical protein AO269_10450 [Pseudomonas putida]
MLVAPSDSGAALASSASAAYAVGATQVAPRAMPMAEASSRGDESGMKWCWRDMMETFPKVMRRRRIM